MGSKWGRWLKFAGINELKTLAKVTSVNVTLMAKNVTWIKNGITISVGVSVKIHKSIVCTKKVILGILQHVVVKMVNMQEVLLMLHWLDKIKL